MAQEPHEPEGGDLLLQEIREETGKLVRHPIEEVKRLEHVAEEGESAATPLIVITGVVFAFVAIFAVFCGVVFAVYYLV